MTFATLRALHVIIGQALDDIEQVYNLQGLDTSSDIPDDTQARQEQPSTQEPGFRGPEPTFKGHETSLLTSHAYASPPPSPSVTSPSNPEAFPGAKIDFPSLDAPYEPTSPSETLTAHPTVIAAIGKIISAAGQLSATVQVPFLTICDATMGYHLPSCMRLLEASHVVEILREAGPRGLHVQAISEKNHVDATKLAHILRLLATHHILLEVSPDTFALNRISSAIDTGKSFAEIQSFQTEDRLELKYKDTNGVAAFVGLCTDECQKSAAYMTETYYHSPSKYTRAGMDPSLAPFCFAFDTVKTRTGFFGWLEGEVTSKVTGSVDEDMGVETGPGSTLPVLSVLSPKVKKRGTSPKLSHPSSMDTGRQSEKTNSNKFRLERFGKAMSGTDGWEAPGAVLNGFDWHSLPTGSIVVDVGGGIGSTSMLLASAFSSNEADNTQGLKFVVQDRPVVCEMGEQAWKAQCPELLGTTATFQGRCLKQLGALWLTIALVHDFFAPQPITDAAVFLLRVVLHDWPDDFARKILVRLRDAAMPSTRLLIADFVLPLACADMMDGLEDVEGAESILAPAPLLPNLGKASANVYWMDMTMQTVFNAQERTLREIVTLAASAGWKIVKVTRTTGSLFGYMVAIPVQKPRTQPSTIEESDSSARTTPVDRQFGLGISVNSEEAHLREGKKYRSDLEVIERASSRCGTPTFGSKLRLSSVQEALTKFGGGMARARNAISRSSSTPSGRIQPPPPLKPAMSLAAGTSMTRKKSKPSPLSVPPVQIGTFGSLQTPVSANGPGPSHSGSSKQTSSSPGQDTPSKHAGTTSHLFSSSQPNILQPPKSPGSRFFPRKLSLANLRASPQSAARTPPPPLPTLTITQQSPSPPGAQTSSPSPPSNVPGMKHRFSNAPATPAMRKSPSVSGILSPTFIPIRSSTSFGGGDTHSSSLGSPSLAASPTITTGRRRLDSDAGATASIRSGTSSFLETASPRQPTSLPRRSSNAQLSMPTHWRKRSGTVVGVQTTTTPVVETTLEEHHPTTDAPSTPGSFSIRSYFSSLGTRSRSHSRAASPSSAFGPALGTSGEQASPASIKSSTRSPVLLSRPPSPIANVETDKNDEGDDAAINSG